MLMTNPMNYCCKRQEVRQRLLHRLPQEASFD
jgi:hypothetical protein